MLNVITNWIEMNAFKKYNDETKNILKIFGKFLGFSVRNMTGITADESYWMLRLSVYSHERSTVRFSSPVEALRSKLLRNK